MSKLMKDFQTDFFIMSNIIYTFAVQFLMELPMKVRLAAINWERE